MGGFGSTVHRSSGMDRSGKRMQGDLGPIIVGDNSSCLEQEEVKEA